jgi:hypothetical protein
MVGDFLLRTDRRKDQAAKDRNLHTTSETLKAFLSTKCFTCTSQGHLCGTELSKAGPLFFYW